MKKWIAILCFALVLLLGLWLALHTAEREARTFLAEEPVPNTTAPARLPETVPETTAAPETQPATEPAALSTTVPEMDAPTETTIPQVLFFTEEEEELLLKIGMAERGDTYCTTCIALVMRTVLNRVESPKFSSSIKGVIYAEDQFTPVAEGTFEGVVPNFLCSDALDMIKQGWDESQGALYYEWCEGASWHSQNLNLLTQHCDTRFYN